MRTKLIISRVLLMLVLCLFCRANVLSAQSRATTNYLKGAVPLEDGRVVFRASFDVIGANRDSLMTLTRNWMDNRNDESDNRISRVLIFDEEKGLVVGGCEEKLVFRSALLLLDQADMKYQLVATCSPESVDMAIIRIRYEYEDDQRFTAEEMITDEVSLSKDQNKILRSHEKWRIKTIDFANAVFRDFNDYLYQSTITQPSFLRRE